ncbi:matrix metalloproteinase-14-like isoform X1 [Neodiprion virginianus]|uniref:matrix metalloproteinase-14-like isoform X1 n=1 Tax=Neodiprion virginianus TaxID=2961670 RepID=UPI001EE6BEC2|nr:matrix metalloproteinase-14-like isoform X1 [Neodiprion virginianus]
MSDSDKVHVGVHEGSVMMRYTVIQVLCIFILSIVEIRGAPISVQKSTDVLSVPPAYALTFMKNFGYLPRGMSGAQAQYSQDSMVNALKTVQKFGNITQTGVFDNNTLQLMKSPRCGVPDVDRNVNTRRKRYVIASKGWGKRNITYYVANWSPKLSEEAVSAEIARAFAAWSGYSRLNFKQINDPSADIIVAFGRGEHGDGNAFDGPGIVLAHAFFPNPAGSYAGDLHFDDDEQWRIRPTESEDGTDFYSVAVHEIGHSLGLDHSPVPTSVMYAYYRGSTPDMQLDYDDILGLYQLYISQHVEDDDFAANEPITTTTERVTTEKDAEVNFVTEVPSRETTTERSYQVTYIGDYEIVEDHLQHQSEDYDEVETYPTSTIPDICDGNFDAISVFRTELFVFKGEYLWRLSKRGIIQNGYPVKFHELFWQLPDYVKKIDAAYQREDDASIILFSGKQYWVYDGYSFIENSPRPLTDYGIDEGVDAIDAVQVWEKNKKVYLYRGEKFWRFNATSRMLDPGYPHNIRRWRGIPSHIDAAMTWIDGKTYFFKDKLFWKFDNLLIKTDNRYPLPAPQYWMGCPERPDTIWW